MYVEHCAFVERNPGDWFVKGHIQIDGEFTRAEWEKIKNTFVALGLFQLRYGRRPSDNFPTRAQVIEAIMEDSRNGDSKATEALSVRYNIPPGIALQDFTHHYEKLLHAEK